MTPTLTESQNAIEIRGLEKSFKGFQLGPIDLSVPRGGIYALIGPNGAGKTTTLDLMFGIGQADRGTIEVEGRDHARDEVGLKRQAAYVPPDSSWATWGKVGRAIQFVRGFYPTWDDALCDRLLAAFRLGREEKIPALSFGALTKLSLVLAMSWRPPVLVLDEPTTGLDPASRQRLFKELLDIVQDESRSVLISSHGLTDLERFADHAGILCRGKMMWQGRLRDLVDGYRRIDFEIRPESKIESSPGLHLELASGGRGRAVIDTGRWTPEILAAHGAVGIRESKLTLEEVFLALTGGE